MTKISQIKIMQAQGETGAVIARELQLDRKTVRKYMQQWDFSPKMPRIVIRSSKLDPFKPVILEWLAQAPASGHPRLTVSSIYSRLLQEYPDTFQGSYSTVRRFVHEAAGKVE